MNPLHSFRNAIRLGGGPVVLLAAVCVAMAAAFVPTHLVSGLVFLIAAVVALAVFAITAHAILPGSAPTVPVPMDRRRRPR